jgi:hypothetical protein
MQENGDNLALYELARKIASKKAGGRYYREDVVSDAYVAVADGANRQRDIENAVRRSLRSEWRLADGRVPVEGMAIFTWECFQAGPEWVRLDLSSLRHVASIGGSGQRSEAVFTGCLSLVQDAQG